ncbi:MAG TPA: response regulator [Blastocatellia bacterium]|nr:response regulator [Blastocatellia bacterium]
MAKILLVEDFPDIRKVLALLLAQSGHEVIEAENGQEGAERAREHHPDLILMDMSLPVMSGWDATRHIKSVPETSDIPIVALTAHALRGDRERAWEAGCDGFITKPIDDELLEHTIDQILSERRSGAETQQAPGPGAQGSERARKSPERVLSIHNEHVLIIDENHESSTALAAELKAQGFRPSIAEGSRQALVIIESEPPDLIICDIDLPESNGYEIVKGIKRNPDLPFIPIILVVEGSVDWEKGLEVGADDFIAKPINIGELLVRVRSLSRLRRAVTAEATRANELASVLSEMVTGLIIADAEGAITVVNGRGLEILGLNLDDVIGKSVDDLTGLLSLATEEYTPLEPSDFPLSRALRLNETLHKQLICVTRRDGSTFVLRFNASPIYSEKGQKLGAVGAFEDVTEEVRSRQQLKDRTRDLEEINDRLRAHDRLKSHFISNIAHEVRTPLDAITALAGSLDRSTNLVPEEVQEMVRRLVTNVQFLNSMVDDLLNYSRIVEGKDQVAPAPFSPHDLVTEVVDSFSPLAGERGLRLELRLHAGLPRWVTNDRSKCRQVLTKILGNAIKYTQKGGVTVEARPRRHGESWTVEVRDTGIGIPAGDLAQIFDEFRQVEVRSDGGQKSTGLGLPISKRLMELMGGRIEVESEMGKGTCFRLTWPVKAPASRGDEAA